MNLYVSYYAFNEVTRVSLDTVIPSITGQIPIASQDTVHIIETGGFLYLVRDPGPGAPLVDKIDPNTMAVVATLLLTMTDWLGTIGPNQNLATDGTYLYVAADRPFADQGRIIRISLATFTEVDFIVDALRTPILTMDENNNLYVGHWFNNVVDRIPAGTFAVDVSLNMTVLACTQAMHCKGNFLYICEGRAVNDRAVQINLTTFAEVTNLNFVAEPWGWSFASDDTNLYCGLASAPGTNGVIVRLTLNPFARVDSLVLPVAENDTWSLFVNDGFLYALTENTPGDVVKIDRATFTRVAGLAFPALQGDAWSGVLWELGIVIPTVTTDPATSVSQTFATPNGTLDDDGGEACACGFEWGPTVAYGNTSPTQSKNTGETFSQILSGLTPGATYHFRAFATNSAGTSYGADRSFTTLQLLVVSKAYALAREEL